jgi:hypothetical protein
MTCAEREVWDFSDSLDVLLTNELLFKKKYRGKSPISCLKSYIYTGSNSRIPAAASRGTTSSKSQQRINQYYCSKSNIPSLPKRKAATKFETPPKGRISSYHPHPHPYPYQSFFPPPHLSSLPSKIQKQKEFKTPPHSPSPSHSPSHSPFPQP